MAFSSGRDTISLEDVLDKTTEANILSYYLGINKIPILICSPLRHEKHPSFGIYSTDGVKCFYKDFSTKDCGTTFSLLGKMWNLPYTKVLRKIYNDLINFNGGVSVKGTPLKGVKSISTLNSNSILQCKTREWRDYDIEYWKQYGVSLAWLKYADVYPISHKIIIKNNQKYILNADKYAYVFVENKEGNTTIKIYQPYNKDGYKWASKHDGSVISLYTKIPKTGDKLCICASLKDALCLWSNIGIPSIALQGEGYCMSNTAIEDLKSRFKNIYILFDNDKAGIEDAKSLSETTGFTNIELPHFYGGKDVSDLYKSKGKKEFIKIIKSLF